MCTCDRGCPLHSAEGSAFADVIKENPDGREGVAPRLEQTPPRLVLMGDVRVGTSALIRSFTRGQFEAHYKPEASKVMRHTKSVYVGRLRGHVTVQFWDIEGSDTYTALLCAHRSHGVAVVYDITERSTFELAQRMLDGVNPRASVLLIGTKVDLHKQRHVSHEEGRLLARIHRVEFLETSAKLNYNVDEAFHILIDSVPDEYLLSKDSAAYAASRRWRTATTTVMCALCHQRLHRHVTRDHLPVQREGGGRHRTTSLSDRRRADPEFEKCWKEKAISA